MGVLGSSVMWYWYSCLSGYWSLLNPRCSYRRCAGTMRRLEDVSLPLFPFLVEESAWGFEIETAAMVLLLEVPAGIPGVAIDAKAESVRLMASRLCGLSLLNRLRCRRTIGSSCGICSRGSNGTWFLAFLASNVGGSGRRRIWGSMFSSTR